MPPRDPRQQPDLEEGKPADDIPGGPYRRDGNVQLILFGGQDPEWRPVRILAWREDRHGREVIDVEWHLDGETWGGTYIADREKIRDG
jgi:hypothetical protein